MNFSKLIPLFGLLVSISLFSCTGNSTQEKDDQITAKDLQGNWSVARAVRNGQATETLDGLFFRFSEDGHLSTNLLGSDQEFSYEVEDNKIYQKGEPALEYAIDELTNKQLVLSTTLQGMDFKLTLTQEQ